MGGGVVGVRVRVRVGLSGGEWECALVDGHTSLNPDPPVSDKDTRGTAAGVGCADADEIDIHLTSIIS